VYMYIESLILPPTPTIGRATGLARCVVAASNRKRTCSRRAG
jgi:hypothetical protein